MSPSRSASITRAVQNDATRLAAFSSLAKRARALRSPVNFTCSNLTAARSPSLLVPRKTMPCPPSPIRPDSSNDPNWMGSPATSGEICGIHLPHVCTKPDQANFTTPDYFTENC
ncbi:hypothetical protein GCM10012278_85050 [Nonomuraea glycinis]|uniref:Uncharacterized protein n=1 Tax=Nonomuraea glycinis TaxID=2047744 RepID=A0A918E9S8_9ACTN|nr:hypothetical protein GCM10012278_85050 [Nonomuraea glycinis]